MVAIPVTVNCVEESSVAVTAVVPKYTVAPGAKCLPLNVKEKAPTGMEIGRIASNSGVGFASVAAVFPDLVLSAVSTAVIVMVFGVGGNSGAVYKPAALIVPSEELPPATPFTDHVRVGFEPSLVFAVNCC